MLVAGALRQRHQLARPLARQRRLASEIGVEPQAPFGAIDGGAVCERFADLGGAAISLLRFRALHAMHDAQRRAELEQQIELAAHALLRIRQGVSRREGRGEMRDRLLISSRPAQGAVAGALAVKARGPGEACKAEMVRQDFRLGVGQRRKTLLQRARDALVQLLAARAQKAVIGDVAGQRMLEAVGRLDRSRLREHQPRIGQLRERGFQFAGADRRDGGQAAPARTAARSRRRFVRSPWRDRAGRAAPSANPAASPARKGDSGVADSATVRVNSSTNSGTPSVLAKISSNRSAVTDCAAAMPATISAHCVLLSRLSASEPT